MEYLQAGLEIGHTLGDSKIITFLEVCIEMTEAGNKSA
jgi:hypothetical protein